MSIWFLDIGNTQHKNHINTSATDTWKNLKQRHPPSKTQTRAHVIKEKYAHVKTKQIQITHPCMLFVEYQRQQWQTTAIRH